MGWLGNVGNFLNNEVVKPAAGTAAAVGDLGKAGYHYTTGNEDAGAHDLSDAWSHRGDVLTTALNASMFIPGLGEAGLAGRAGITALRAGSDVALRGATTTIAKDAGVAAARNIGKGALTTAGFMAADEGIQSAQKDYAQGDKGGVLHDLGGVGLGALGMYAGLRSHSPGAAYREAGSLGKALSGARSESSALRAESDTALGYKGAHRASTPTNTVSPRGFSPKHAGEYKGSYEYGEAGRGARINEPRTSSKIKTAGKVGVGTGLAVGGAIDAVARTAGSLISNTLNKSNELGNQMNSTDGGSLNGTQFNGTTRFGGI